MTLPAFTAEAAIGPASRTYGYACGGAAASPGLQPAALGGLGWQLPQFKCCKYVPYFKSVVCSTARRLPGQTCRCFDGYFGEPIAICEGGHVFTPA